MRNDSVTSVLILVRSFKRKLVSKTRLMEQIPDFETAQTLISCILATLTN